MKINELVSQAATSINLTNTNLMERNKTLKRIYCIYIYVKIFEQHHMATVESGFFFFSWIWRAIEVIEKMQYGQYGSVVECPPMN